MDIVIHSYRHRYGYAPGDPDLETIEQRLAETPAISVPTIALYGGGDGVGGRANPQTQARFFSGSIQHRVIPVIGHDIPQEAPAAVAAAVLDLVSARSTGDRRGG